MNVEEIRKLAKQKALVFGTEKTLKLLRQQKIAQVFLTKNCPASVREEIKAHLNAAEIVELDQTNQELAVLCKVPHLVSVMSLPAP